MGSPDSECIVDPASVIAEWDRVVGYFVSARARVNDVFVTPSGEPVPIAGAGSRNPLDSLLTAQLVSDQDSHGFARRC
jgi:hypothetical protein